MGINSDSSVRELIGAITVADSQAEVIQIMKHPKAGATVLDAAFDWAKLQVSNQQRDKILTEITNSGKVTPELLVGVIKCSVEPDLIINVINNPKADTKVLDEAIAQAKLQVSNQQRDKILTEITNSGKVTSELLVEVIKCSSEPSLIINAIKSPKADTKVLDAAIAQAEQQVSNQQRDKILTEITNSGKVTPELLVEVIRCSREPDLIINAIKSPKAGATVLAAGIKWLQWQSIYIYRNYNKIFEEITNSDKVTSELLVEVIKCSSEPDLIINAIKSPKADTMVLDAAIAQAEQQVSNQQRDKILTEITNSGKVTSELLVGVIKCSSEPSLIISAIKSLKADTMVLDAALERANECFSESSVYSAIYTAIEDKLNFIQEIFKIEDSVTERIRRNVEDGMSTMLWGLSGIGKTARVREIDPTFTMIKLKNNMLPEEVTGGKEPNGEPGKMYPPNWYVKLCEKCEAEPDRMHILFIDELTNVKDSVKSLVWDIIEDRRVNGNEDWQLPDNCAIVAAGNRPEESTSVITDYTGGVLPEPLHDRFDFHIEISLDMREWQQWALETDPKTGFLNIHPSVLSFCVPRANEVMFSKLDPTDVTQPRLSPRRWAKLSKALFMAEKRGCHVSNQRISECIGKELAPAFIAHYEKQLLDMEKVVSGYYKPSDFPSIDDKLFAISAIIASKVESELAVIDFIELCLGDEYVEIYDVMKRQRDEAFLGEAKVAETVLRSTSRI